MQRTDFSYELPDRLIARFPLAARTASRLLRVGDPHEHLSFTDVLNLLAPTDVLVVNDTRVLKARLRGEKDSGGSAEVLIERVVDQHEALAMVRVSKPLKTHRSVSFGGELAEVLGREGMFYRLRFERPVLEVLDAAGEIPLPPYMERAPESADEERYQTVFSDKAGAVAAPTAGLHFDDALLERIRLRGVQVVPVTLHVGAGTFQPVRVDQLAEHRMHAEVYDVPEASAAAIRAAKKEGGRVVAVGTTVVRTLEAASAGGDLVVGPGETDLFITPGYQFRCVDALITNFHLPESTLLMLVSAFAGYDRVMSAYRSAVEAEYRFFSYGDAMFLERADV